MHKSEALVDTLDDQPEKDNLIIELKMLAAITLTLGAISFVTGRAMTNSPKKSISVPVAAIFIVGTMCGSGILALPKAVVDAGWAGIPLLIICGLISAYTGNLLGKCWTIVRVRYPEYDYQHIPDPYPTIGFRAAGKWGEQATRICIFLTLFGSGVVFLLLIGGNLANLVDNLGNIKFHTCFFVLITAGLLTPFSWLGTPKDFWQAGILAAVSTTLGAIFIVIGLALMAPSQPNVNHSNPTFESFFGAFGTILFAFGGASIFPTIQLDMKNPDKFPLSVVIGIISVLVLYISVTLSGFLVLGDSMEESNILDNMAHNWILYTIIILITSHLLLAFLVVVNPVFQDLEGLFNIADKFSLQRVILRTVLMIAMTFVALSVPHFIVILSLVGGTTMTATNFVFPPLFYILLSRQKTPSDEDENLIGVAFNWHEFEIPTYLKILLVEIIAIGIIGGIATTYSTMSSLVSGDSRFTVPCYIDWGAGDP